MLVQFLRSYIEYTLNKNNIAVLGFLMGFFFLQTPLGIFTKKNCDTFIVPEEVKDYLPSRC